MRLNSIGESNAPGGSPAPRRANAAVAKPTLEGDQLTLSGSDALNPTLGQTQTARAEKVAQAKALLQDSSYPSAAQVGQIAELLAKNLRP